MALTLDLTKSKQSLVLNLAKAGVTELPKIDVAFLLDVSGSFDDEHREGVTNDLMTRLIPWALVFDPDQKMEVYTFSNGAQNVHHAGDISEKNYIGYIQREIIDCPGYRGGTDYSFAIEQVLSDLGWAPLSKQQSLLAKWFSAFTSNAAKDLPRAPVRKSLIFIVTDGENSDAARTEQVLQASQARADGVYFHFLGVSNQSAHFPFIEHLGEKFVNVGFTPVKQVRQWVRQSDDAINGLLISKELIGWIKT